MRGTNKVASEINFVKMYRTLSVPRIFTGFDNVG